MHRQSGFSLRVALVSPFASPLRSLAKILRWLGQAPMRPYNPVLSPRGMHNHFPNWRGYREYCGGALTDMGAHHFDIAQWALGMDESGPREVIPPEDPKANTGVKFVYANGVEMFHGGPSGCTFEGTAGKLYIDRGKLTLTLHKIPRTTFCCICNKRLSCVFRMIARQSFPVGVRKRHKSSAKTCLVRLKLQILHQLLQQ